MHIGKAALPPQSSLLQAFRSSEALSLLALSDGPNAFSCGQKINSYK